MQVRVPWETGRGLILAKKWNELKKYLPQPLHPGGDLFVHPGVRLDADAPRLRSYGPQRKARQSQRGARCAGAPDLDRILSEQKSCRDRNGATHPITQRAYCLSPQYTAEG